MAILSSSGIYSFLCSCKKVGSEYLEHFKSGFAGHGWKIWERWPGKWCFEIDDMVVRGKMTVFEMIISKIRFIRGALGITQANGTVKAVADMEDSFKLTIDQEMSFVADDFIKCQQFSNGVHGYHVKVDRIEGNMIVILKSEFNKDADGNVSDPPRVGDELVQFGNQTDQTRQSAIYLHADEGGQPSIDVMFGIKSKDWTGCVKISLGGSIPGHEGFNGFYCENGMVLSVDEKKEVIYKFSPDGSFSLGRGKISYDPKTDKVNLNGVTLDWGEIENAPTPEPGEPGKPGADGKVFYTWLRYADTSDGSGISNNPTGKLYIGFAYNKETAVESNTASDYKWSLIKGTDGVPGEPGEDGKTTYTWIAYSDNADGSGMYQIPKDSTKYIGIAVNKDTATEGINPAEYTWILFKGTDGKPGTDANLLHWIQEYEDNKTLIGGEYVISPKMFSGTSRIDENGKQWLTGIAMGRDCITDPDGTKRTGIFAIVDNEVVFALDPITKKYLFKGRVEADEGAFKGKVTAIEGKIGGFDITGYGLSNSDNKDSFIYIKTENDRFYTEYTEQGTITETKYKEIRSGYLGNKFPGQAGFDAASSFEAIGMQENRSITTVATGSKVQHGMTGGLANLAVDAVGGVNWEPAIGDHWRMPGVLCAADVRGNPLALYNKWGNGATITGVTRNSDQSFTINHDLNHEYYYVLAMPGTFGSDDAWHEITVQLYEKKTKFFTLYFKTGKGDTIMPNFFSFLIFGMPSQRDSTE